MEILYIALGLLFGLIGTLIIEVIVFYLLFVRKPNRKA